MIFKRLLLQFLCNNQYLIAFDATYIGSYVYLVDGSCLFIRNILRDYKADLPSRGTESTDDGRKRIQKHCRNLKRLSLKWGVGNAMFQTPIAVFELCSCTIFWGTYTFLQYNFFSTLPSNSFTCNICFGLKM